MDAPSAPIQMRSSKMPHPRATSDPFSQFPAEVALNVLRHIELEELLLSTRLTCRAWNALLFTHLSHLVVSSYDIRIDMGRTRLTMALKLRPSSNGEDGLEIYAAEKVATRVYEPNDVRWFTLSAGIVNRGISRAYMSNHVHPTLQKVISPEGRRVCAARLDEIQYANSFTNTGLLDVIKMRIVVQPIVFVEDADQVPMESMVSVTIDPMELTKWIVLCRLAQGYETPTETRERESPMLKFNGIVAPYVAYKNSAGIWGRSPPRITV